MAVITPDGIVGKVLRVYHASSQVLLINDPDSGVGAILESSRLQGILQGTAAGETMLNYVMSDEKVAAGERVLTSGGDRIFPKGLPVGAVQQTNPGSDLFLNIRVKPAADLSRLEEVLVVTRVVETTPQTAEPSGPVRAADILAERLPSVPPKLLVPAPVRPRSHRPEPTSPPRATARPLRAPPGRSRPNQRQLSRRRPAPTQPRSQRPPLPSLRPQTPRARRRTRPQPNQPRSL